MPAFAHAAKAGGDTDVMKTAKVETRSKYNSTEEPTRRDSFNPDPRFKPSRYGKSICPNVLAKL